MSERIESTWRSQMNVLRKVFDDQIVLIGENALSLWAQYYGLDDVADIGTKELQFYANHADMEAADVRLSPLPHSASFDAIDHESPLPSHIGSIHVENHHDSIVIDYFGHVDGVTNSDIRLQALPYVLEANNSTTLKVMHPMMCLDYWITKLAQSHKEKNPHLVRCSTISIEVARLYIEDCVNKKNIAIAMDAIQRVLMLADSGAGQRAWHLHGVDVSAAVPALTLLADNCS